MSGRSWYAARARSSPLLRCLPFALLVALLSLATPAVAFAQPRAASTRVVASGALDGAGGRVLSLSLTPTADGRAVGTLRYVDHAAKLRLRAQRVESLRVEDGVTTVAAAAVLGRERGYRLSLVLRAPAQPGARAAVALDVVGPAGSYHAEGELVGGVTRLPRPTRAIAPAAPQAAPPVSQPAQPAPPPPGQSATVAAAPVAPAAAPPAPAAPAPTDPLLDGLAAAASAGAVDALPGATARPENAPARADDPNPMAPTALAAAAIAAQVAGVAPASAAAPAHPTGPAPAPPAATVATGADVVVDGLASAALALVQRLDVAAAAARADAYAGTAPAVPAAAPPPSGSAPPAPAVASPEVGAPAAVHAPAATRPSPAAAVPRPATSGEPSALAAVLGQLASSAAPPGAAAIPGGSAGHAPGAAPAAVAPAGAGGATPGTAELSPIGQAVALLGARLAEDPELAGPAQAVAQELRPILVQEAAAHPAAAQAIGRQLDAAVAAAQKEPGAEVAFAAVLDRARAWRRAIGPDGVDRQLAREALGRYRSFSESWARAAAAAAAERTSPDAWAAATALGISLIDQPGLIGAGEAALARDLEAARSASRDGLLPLDAADAPAPVACHRAAATAAGPSACPSQPPGARTSLRGNTSTARLGESDFPIPNGHFFTQTGRPERAGFAVTDQDGVPFWSAFQQMGGVPVLGYPASHRFEWDGFTVQVFQRAVLQWRPESGQVYLVNVLDRLHAGGLDAWLIYARQTPPPQAPDPDPLHPWDDAGARLGALDAYPALQAAYYAAGPAIHGLPTSRVVDMGNHYAVRTQRTVLQLWKQDVPWARAGEATVALAGDIVKESGLLTDHWALEPMPWIETN